tara:strand:+ start:8479 stop:9363 length:885 start_codon:yes stop_codon:yes gene_type:complete
MSEQTQVDLDFEDEKETIVEIPEQVEEQTDSLPTPEGQEDSSGEDEDSFKKSQNATQKRIDKLTKRYRESERQQQEATNFAQQVLAENEQLKNRLNALDTNYVNEYSGRVESEMGQAEQELARAIELGDSAATVAAQKRMTQLALQADRAERAKLQQQAQAAQPQAAQQPPQQQQQAGPQRPDPKAEEWAARNPWFGEDEAKTYAAFGIHKKLIEEQGFDPKSDEYYTELDRQIADTFSTAPDNTGKRPVQTVAGASRTTTGRSGKQVRLTPSQVAIAKKLGVPLEEYAKYVKE